MADKTPFEIPEPMRELAEKNVEQARQAYNQFMDMAKQAQDMMAKSSGAVAQSAQDVQGKAMGYAQKNLEAGFSFASDLARARDVKEAVEIQARYAQEQMRTYTEQAQELGRLMSDAAKKMQSRG